MFDFINLNQIYMSAQFSTVVQSCLTICDPMDCSMPGFPVNYQVPELAQTHVHQVSDTIQPILCDPLLLPPSIFPSIRVFSYESVLRIRWPEYWCFSFSISPSNEYSELIFFRINWLDLLAVQGTLEILLQHHSSKAYTLYVLSVYIMDGIYLLHMYTQTFWEETLFHRFLMFLNILQNVPRR